MTPAQQIAWHRSEAARIEAEERARRPALAAGQVWKHPQYGETIIGEWGIVNSHELIAFSIFGKLPAYAGIASLSDEWEYVGLARDVLRVVPPGTESAQPRTVYLGEEWRRMGDDEVIVEGDLCANDEHPIPHHQHWWENFPGTTVREAIVLGKDGASLRFFRKAQPDPPAPQVAPEPTGAELVGRRCWVRDEEDAGWVGPFEIEHVVEDSLCRYRKGVVGWRFAKPYVEGVAP